MTNVLIVDDDIDLLEGQKLFLEEHGYIVKTAVSRKEGIEALNQFKPVLPMIFFRSKRVRSSSAISSVNEKYTFQSSTPRAISHVSS